jgi:putative tryptophan/tyrosine transport system substrate-binding protein
MKCLSLLVLLLTLTSCQNSSRPLPLHSLVDRYFIEDGGLTSYGAKLIGLYRRVASYVDRIFKGEKPHLPVQQPTKYKLVINLKTAKALGVDVPPTLLVLAGEATE